MSPVAIGLAVAAVIAVVAFVAMRSKAAAKTAAAASASGSGAASGAASGSGSASGSGAGVSSGPWASTLTGVWTPSTFSFPCPEGVTSTNGSGDYCLVPQASAQSICAADPACKGYLTLPPGSGGWGSATWLTGGSNPQGVLMNVDPVTGGTYAGVYYPNPAPAS